MIPDSEIEKEIKRIQENPYEDINVDCIDNFDTDSYIRGLKFSLGEDIVRKDWPSNETVENIISDIKNDIPSAENIKIERQGIPPHLTSITVIVTVSINSVEEANQINSKLKSIARQNEKENEFVGTYLDKE